jgi:GrpB-like predicted nucleotidyltransferase (UPF0157 family)
MISSIIDEPVHIVKYDPSWPQSFDHEKRLLLSSADETVIGIEHIGSTAVPQLMAKPIIDIMIGITNYPPSNKLLTILSSIGYTSFGEAGVPERVYLTKRGPKNFNLALVTFGGSHWQRNLKFRNYLRQNPDVCHQYEEIKQAALETGAQELLSYSSFKNKFLNSVFEKIDQEKYLKC